MWPDRVSFVSSEHLLTFDFTKECLLTNPPIHVLVSQPEPNVRVIQDKHNNPELHVLFMLYPSSMRPFTTPYIGLMHDINGNEIAPFVSA
jgi:hypothetical protein